ncbi:hypothetical protein H5410_028109 [Solanum commersonii]|uniref:Uncharacterized protein n=1 Tax=Solanum commersonii TaxID=4109 RepID=A0A9J5Z151_SOLCO|nr:hypothetical protein H5410_028109 [Solanum commersonii]
MELKPFEFLSSSKPSSRLELKILSDHSASLVEITHQLGDPPFVQLHRTAQRYANYSFSLPIRSFPSGLSTLEQTARIRSFGDSPNGFGNSQIFISSFFHLSLFLFFLGSQTQVQPFKKGVSNSTTQDSIMNAHNKI